MKLVVDGVFYQLAESGIARIWSSILPLLAKTPGLDIVLLDRTSCPTIDGIINVEFPLYTLSGNTAADSILIDDFCTRLGADVFSSTYYTTPLTVPSVLVVYDMIPEVLSFDMSARPWKEKQIAIGFASYYACISENTKRDLKSFYPSVSDERAIVTHCGVDRNIFFPRSKKDIEAFKAQFKISKPYYVMVGSRRQQMDYKNGMLVFTAVRHMRKCEFDLLCVGGEPDISGEELAQLPADVSARVVKLTDDQLACAYAGAEALVYPSLYEGFGLPVVEAMAAECPVISTRCGSLGEVLGDAAIFISGRDRDELRLAMEQIRDSELRKRLVERGRHQLVRYSWEAMALGFNRLLEKAVSESQSAAMPRFFREWSRLRRIQADVDTIGHG